MRSNQLRRSSPGSRARVNSSKDGRGSARSSSSTRPSWRASVSFVSTTRYVTGWPAVAKRGRTRRAESRARKVALAAVASTSSAPRSANTWEPSVRLVSSPTTAAAPNAASASRPAGVSRRPSRCWSEETDRNQRYQTRRMAPR